MPRRSLTITLALIALISSGVSAYLLTARPAPSVALKKGDRPMEDRRHDPQQRSEPFQEPGSIATAEVAPAEGLHPIVLTDPEDQEGSATELALALETSRPTDVGCRPSETSGEFLCAHASTRDASVMISSRHSVNFDDTVTRSEILDPLTGKWVTWDAQRLSQERDETLSMLEGRS